MFTSSPLTHNSSLFNLRLATFIFTLHFYLRLATLPPVNSHLSITAHRDHTSSSTHSRAYHQPPLDPVTPHTGCHPLPPPPTRTILPPPHQITKTMDRKRSFTSPGTDSSLPSTPLKANDDSELDLSQSPAAKRAKRLGRLSQGSVMTMMGTPTTAQGRGVKRVRFSDEDEMFTPGVGGVKRKIGELGRLEGTPFEVRIGRVGGGRRGENGEVGGGGDAGADGVDVKEEEEEEEGLEGEKSGKKKRSPGGSGKKSKKKKKKRKSLVVVGDGDAGMDRMGEMFPDLPKPSAAVGEEDPCRRDSLPSEMDEAQDCSQMELDGTPGVDFGIHEDDVADEKGDEEVKEFIEEVFARPEFEYRVGEEIGTDGSGAMAAAEDYLDRKESPGTLSSTTPSNTAENDDVAAIKSLLHSLDTKISALASESAGQDMQNKIGDVQEDLRGAYDGMVRLYEQLERDEMRAAVRHEILFNGMKSIVGELGAVRREQEAVMRHLGLEAESPLAVGRKDKNKEGKKALESCLRTYLEGMGRATEREEVVEKGLLAVEYAGRFLGGL